MAGGARRGGARRAVVCWAGRGKAGEARQARLGRAGHVEVWRVRARFGTAWQAWRGEARRCIAGRGKAG